MADEVRVTDPDTGGEKGRKAERYSLLPAGPLAEVARLYGRGADKYEAHNWRRGYAWSLSADALHRHLAAFESGRFYDDETGCHHLASVVFHALALMEFTVTHPEKDDVTPDGVTPYDSTDTSRPLAEQEGDVLGYYADADLEPEHEHVRVDLLERARFVADEQGGLAPTDGVTDLQGRRVLIYDTPGKGDALNGLGTITSGPAYYHADADDYLVAVLADSGDYPYYYLLSTLQLLEEGDADA